MPLLTFFEPLEPFLPWVKQYAADRLVFDVGCGTGHFLRRMWNHGIKAIGIDLYADAIEDEDVRRLIMLGDACEVSMLRKRPALVMFCRPSHSGWVGRVISSNLHPESEVLYISKPGNQFVDLPDFTLELVAAPGLDIEQVWRVKRPYPEVSGEPDYYTAAMARLQETLSRNQAADRGW